MDSGRLPALPLPPTSIYPSNGPTPTPPARGSGSSDGPASAQTARAEGGGLTARPGPSSAAHATASPERRQRGHGRCSLHLALAALHRTQADGVRDRTTRLTAAAAPPPAPSASAGAAGAPLGGGESGSLEASDVAGRFPSAEPAAGGDALRWASGARGCAEETDEVMIPFAGGDSCTEGRDEGEGAERAGGAEGEGRWGAGLASGGPVCAGTGPLHSFVVAGSSRLSVAGESRGTALSPLVLFDAAEELAGEDFSSHFNLEAMTNLTVSFVADFEPGLESILK